MHENELTPEQRLRRAVRAAKENAVDGIITTEILSYLYRVGAGLFDSRRVVEAIITSEFEN